MYRKFLFKGLPTAALMSCVGEFEQNRGCRSDTQEVTAERT